MADAESPKEVPIGDDGIAAVEVHHDVQSASGDKEKLEEVEMDTKVDHTVLDFEASNPLLPEPPHDVEQQKDSSRRSSKFVKQRKPSITLEDPIGKGLGEIYYDDEDWISNDEDGEDGDGEKKRTRNILVLLVQKVQNVVISTTKHFNRLAGGHLLAIILLVAYAAYFVRAMTYELGSEPSLRLLVCTILGVLIWVRQYVYKLFESTFVKINGCSELSPRANCVLKKIRLVVRWLLYLALAAVMAFTIMEQAQQSMTNLRSLPGLGAFLLICLLFSSAPGNINWHTIYWSVGLQFLCALFVLKWEMGQDVILWIQYRLDEFIAHSEEGSKFLFGDSYKDHYMIFGALPLVLFINATLVVLYYLGAMQFIIRVIGSFLSFITDTSPVESTSVVSSIFLEGVISALTLKPYLGGLSRSQLFLVITSIFSSLGGAYISLLSTIGVPLSTTVPAMLISAPATIAVCKLMMPESSTMIKKQKKEGKKYDWEAEVKREKAKYSNVLDAAQDGAVSMLSVIAIMLAVGFVFLSYISWVNQTLGWFGDRVGVPDLTIEKISSYVLFPVSLAMGIEWEDCRRVATLLGHRIGSVNIIAFTKLLELKVNKAQYMQYMMATNYTGPVTKEDDDITLDLWGLTLKNGFMSDRSETIVTYSLCGYSSFLFGSMVLGIMYILLPKRRAWLAKVFGAALIAGNIANCMTGCFASLFY